MHRLTQPDIYSVEGLTLALSEAKLFHQTKEIILKESCNISERKLKEAREEIAKLHQDIARLRDSYMDSSEIHDDIVKENEDLKRDLEGVQSRLRTAQREIETLREQDAGSKDEGAREVDKQNVSEKENLQKELEHAQNELGTAQQEIKTLREQNARSKSIKDEAVREIEKQFVGEMAGIKENVERTLRQLQEAKDDICRQLEMAAAKPGAILPQSSKKNGVNKLGSAPELIKIKEDVAKAEDGLRAVRLEMAKLRAYAVKLRLLGSRKADPETPRRNIDHMAKELASTRERLKEAVDEVAKLRRANKTRETPPESVLEWTENPPPNSDEKLANDFRGLCQSIKDITDGPWYMYDANFYRKLRVQAKFFELVHDKILSAKSFGVIGYGQRVDIETSLWRAHHFFTKRKLHPEALKEWKAKTIDCLEQCRSTEEHINITATEIFNYFKPILSSRFSPSDEKELMSAITELCNDGYDLRLRIYQSPGTYECKMLDPKQTHLASSNLSWVHCAAVEGGTDKEASDTIAYTLSGALINHSRLCSVVLEKAQVVLHKRKGERQPALRTEVGAEMAWK